MDIIKDVDFIPVINSKFYTVCFCVLIFDIQNNPIII